MKSYGTIICWVALITIVGGCSNQVRKINETGEMLDDAMNLSESYLGKVSKSGAETQQIKIPLMMNRTKLMQGTWTRQLTW